MSDPSEDPPAIALIVGPGRSGTSTLAVSLQMLGMQVPQPEVLADKTNPKGFGEPQWLVDMHSGLLRKANVQPLDARPSAWGDVARLANGRAIHRRATDWLAEECGVLRGELVLKDPRLAWFLPLWGSVATASGRRPVHLTMLRPVTEVVRSRQHYYAAPFSAANRVAGWVNMMLQAELSTRGSDRAFIRYDDLLTDWRRTLREHGERLGLRTITAARDRDLKRVDDFIDPSLRRMHATWEDLPGVTAQLQELAVELWRALDHLANEPGGDHRLHRTFDQLRVDYSETYQAAEAVAESTAYAARLERQRRSATPRRLVLRVARALPFGVRTRIPPRLRRRLEDAVKGAAQL